MRGMGEGGVWKGTDGIGLCCGGIETQCSGNFLESTKVTLMRTPSDKGYGLSIVHHCCQVRPPVAGLDCIQFSFGQWGPRAIPNTTLT